MWLTVLTDSSQPLYTTSISGLHSSSGTGLVCLRLRRSTKMLNDLPGKKFAPLLMFESGY